MPAKGLACRKGGTLIMPWGVRSLSESPGCRIHCEVFLPTTPHAACHPHAGPRTPASSAASKACRK